ncbi:Uncharacterised protein [Streptococcus pneumoniae]|uniref:Uncharacterized protein n=1 Tax=Streptococcus pneumoniae TaxID=1313 RepID=A0A0T8ZZ12_STREE|nr:Uncharacterised protein [Streptococcus pneumoniae]CEX45657.1 Uncharacterised protein [Streptococcus pneumoniae]CEX70559.1 Uncharacterised protein [Streptococcus pneumoniae]CEZ99497.1 Uncharacterised protein [Streptococcus pneumoniae]CFC63902.1 Uncharacterised protein [Streptococcus pneumoniae]
MQCARISLYEFIGDIFYSKITSCCIVAKDLSKNTMKLDVKYYEIGRHIF